MAELIDKEYWNKIAVTVYSLKRRKIINHIECDVVFLKP